MQRILLRTLATAALGGALLSPSIGHTASVRAGTTVTVTPNNFVRVFPHHLNTGNLILRLFTPGKQDLTSVNVAQLHHGVKPAVIARLLKAGQIFPALGSMRLVGGVDSLHAHAQIGSFDLPAGTYVVFSLDQATANKNPTSPTTFFTVGAAGSATAFAATVTALDFKFRVSNTIPAGMDTIRFTNHGKSPHELQLMRLAPGKTMHDLKMALMSNNNGPPPSWITPVGGWGIVSPGSTMYAHTTFTTGNYVMLCFVPDLFSYPGHKASHKPHFMLGMIKMVHVA